jgi:2-polyprenyl-3-methyl-5-hydroxy-6-metoxy-1,4-benzoquinol methylase
MSSSPEFELRETPCAICGSSSRKHLGWRGGAAHHDRRGVRLEIVRCNTCTHLYPHPMPFPRAGLGSLYTDPDDYFSAHDVEDKKKLGREIMRTVENRLQRRGALLDVGCGRGEVLWAAGQAGWEFEGLDPSRAYLEWARVNLGIEAHLGTLEEIKFFRRKF